MISNLKTLLKSVALIPVATVLFSGSAQAALIGDTVNGQFGVTGDVTLLNQNAVVTDPGVEFAFVTGDAAFSLDVKDDSFDIIYDLGSFFNVSVLPTTWTLSDLDFDFAGTPGRIRNVTQVSGNSSLIDNISFTDDSITVDIATYSVPPSNAVQTFSFDIDAEPVPEPITLLGTGAALGFGILMKKKKGAKSA